MADKDVGIAIAAALAHMDLIRQVAATDVQAHASGFPDSGSAGLPPQVLQAVAADYPPPRARQPQACAPVTVHPSPEPPALPPERPRYTWRPANTARSAPSQPGMWRTVRRRRAPAADCPKSAPMPATLKELVEQSGDAAQAAESFHSQEDISYSVPAASGGEEEEEEKEEDGADEVAHDPHTSPDSHEHISAAEGCDVEEGSEPASGSSFSPRDAPAEEEMLAAVQGASGASLPGIPRSPSTPLRSELDLPPRRGGCARSVQTSPAQASPAAYSRPDVGATRELGNPLAGRGIGSVAGSGGSGGDGPALDGLRALLSDATDLIDWYPQSAPERQAKADALAYVPRLLASLEDAVLDAVLVDAVAELARLDIARAAASAVQHPGQDRPTPGCAATAPLHDLGTYLCHCERFEETLLHKYGF